MGLLLTSGYNLIKQSVTVVFWESPGAKLAIKLVLETKRLNINL